MKTNDVIDAADETPLRAIKPLGHLDFVIADARRVTHHLLLPDGTTLDDLALPEIWASLTKKMHKNDLVEVTDVLGTLWALLLVREVGHSHAVVHVLTSTRLPPLHVNEDDLPLGYSVKFHGPKTKWCVQRNEQVIKQSCDSKGAALTWLRESGLV